MRFQIVLVRFLLNSLVRVSPRMAGAVAFRLFCTPLFRAAVPPVLRSILDGAEHRTLDVDGVRVAVYRWAASRPGAPRVLLSHGWQSRAGRIANWVEPLREAGFEVVAYDGPAHGESTGRQAHPMRFAAAIRAVARELGPLEAIVGHSLGAFAGLFAVAGGSLVGEEDLEVERLVVVAGAESGNAAMAFFCDVLGLRPAVLEAMRSAATRRVGFPPSAFDGRRLMAGSSLPILWFHDPADAEVPIAGARAVGAVAPGVELVETPGLGHHEIVRDPAIVARGVAFLAAPGRCAGLEATDDCAA